MICNSLLSFSVMYFWIFIHSLMSLYMNIKYLGHSHILTLPSLQTLPVFQLHSLYNFPSFWPSLLSGWVHLVLPMSQGHRAPTAGVWAAYHGTHPWGKLRPLLQQPLTATRPTATGLDIESSMPLPSPCWRDELFLIFCIYPVAISFSATFFFNIWVLAFSKLGLFVYHEPCGALNEHGPP